MSFDTQIASPKIEKHSLVIIRPRIRKTSWAVFSGSVFRTPFTFGYVNRVWNSRASDADNGFTLATSTSLSEGEYYYDAVNKYLYVFSEDGSFNPLSPDDFTYPGLTVEFELNLSDQAFIGPRDPLDAASAYVNWIPALKSAPSTQYGARDTLYGFLPTNQSSLAILNQDSWMNEFLHDASWNACIVKSYILVNQDIVDGANNAEVSQVFLGYTSGMSMRDFIVSLTCSDFFRFFDKKISLRKITDTNFVNIDPAATQTGAEWFIRRIFGFHDSYAPINVDYNATPSTSNNRVWVTHNADFKTDGITLQNDGNLNYTVDHLQANTATRTYFTATPKVLAFDTMAIQRSGVFKYTFITAVNSALKYVDHISITGSAASGDIASRSFIGRIDVVDSLGNKYELWGGRDYTIFVDNVNNVRGFTLNNNFESTLLDSPFDPATWKISCRVYGKSSLDTYSDSSDVGLLTNFGGVNSQSISAIYRLLLDAGFSSADIEEPTFQSLTPYSYNIGLAIPDTQNGSEVPTYKDLVNKLLSCNMYKLSIFDSGTYIKMGITQLIPFLAPDYSANELNHKGMDYEHDYNDIYSDIKISFAIREVPEIDTIVFSERGERQYVLNSDFRAALDLHFIRNTFSLDTILVFIDEATELARRFAIVFSDRRAFYSFEFELTYIKKADMGSVYAISRQRLPGFSYQENILKTRNMVVSEVNKSPIAVSITFEDQKAMQDNLVDW